MSFTEEIINSSPIIRQPKDKPKAKKAQPFIQWVGGKRRLLDSYDPLFPKEFNNYYEPFLGGGAVFYHLENKYKSTKKYFLSDLNQELIITYRTLPKQYIAVQSLLHHMNMRHCKEFYLKVRNYDREEIKPKRYRKTKNILEELTPIEIAARFIYLNQTCFNSVYRVNSDGLFNVPYGRSDNKDISDNDTLIHCANALSLVDIKCQSYRFIQPQKTDLVFLDPPYAPVSATSNFTSYTAEGFSLKDQVELKEFCDKLNQSGVYFMLANSNCEFIRDLYKDYNQHTFCLNRTLNSKAELRRQTEDNEILITNY